MNQGKASQILQKSCTSRAGKDHPDAHNYGNIAVYWADGKRSLLDISRLVEMEAGSTDLMYLAGYFELLKKLKLLEY